MRELTFELMKASLAADNDTNFESKTGWMPASRFLHIAPLGPIGAGTTSG